ncbi:MAG: acetyltransferase, GNAT family [Anaerolineae bacterium]|jgi:RimJ/RimL family protein N-acetyltransferase|nr:MAG: acetyltransferase, GNAT family [Anaerolineae bacterium]
MNLTYPPPALQTPRLRLRPFNLKDAERVALLAGDFDIAQMTSNIPHPYEVEMAIQWIQSHESQFISDSVIHYAVTFPKDDLLIGAVGLEIDLANQSAELGYWIGKPYWNQGFATEAASAVLAFAFLVVGLNRVQARYMTKNPASGRVLEKLGMAYEGTLHQSILRFGKFEDVDLYSILREEYMA